VQRASHRSSSDARWSPLVVASISGRQPCTPPADAAIQRLDLTFESLEASMRNDDHQQLRAILGDSAFDLAYEQGRDLPLAAALTMASETATTDLPVQ